MKRYHIRLALLTFLIVVLAFPGAALGQGGGDGEDDRGPVDGEDSFSSGQSSPDLTGAQGTGTNGLQPEGFDERGTAALASSGMVISEIWTGAIDGVELYNRSGGTINIGSWTVFIYDDLTGASSVSYTFPATCNIPAGATVHIREDAGISSCTTRSFYLNTNIFWVDTGVLSDGGVSLRNSVGQGNASIDFMRFGGNSFLSGGADWTGFNPLNANAGAFQSLQRVNNGFDDDWGDNYCVGSASMHAVNSVTFCPLNYVKITEVDTGDPDRIEIYNGGTRGVNLVGSSLLFDDDQGANNVLAPDFTHNVLPIDLTPGSRVVFVEGNLANTATTQYMPTVSVLWLNTSPDGWVSIREFDTTTWHDLTWFGNVALVNYTYNPMIDVNGEGLSRTAATSGAVPYSALQGRNFCSVTKTIGAANVACPSEANLRINELTPGTPDVLEIYNAGGRAVNLRSAKIDILQATVAPYGYGYTYTFGDFDILPFQHIEVREFSGTNDFNTLYTGQNIDWVNGRGGAVVHDNGNIVGDFVRLRDSVYTTPITTFTGNMGILSNENLSHGRSPNGFDTNSASNFCQQNNSFPGVNTACVTINLVASASCVDPNLRVIITAGDGPFNITVSEGQNMPVNGVSNGTHTILGPDRWRDITVTETNGNFQSAVLSTKLVCRSTQATVLQAPPHQSHTTDTTPFFNWTDTTDGNLYRIFIFDDPVVATRTVDIRENNALSQWTPVTPLPTMRLFWRARARVNSAWGYWSVRWTLFVDPVVAQEGFSDGNVEDSVSSGQTPVPVAQLPNGENGGLLPSREDVGVSAPLPLEIAPDVTGLMAFEAESLKSTAGAWAMRGDANASGSTMVVSSGQPTDAVTVNFTGDRFGLQYGTFPGGGNLTLMIDESIVGTFNTDDDGGFGLKVFGLSAGNHTARIFSTDGIIAVDTVYATGLIEPANESANAGEGDGSSGDGTVPSVQAPSVNTAPEVQQPSVLPAPPNSR